MRITGSIQKVNIEGKMIAIKRFNRIVYLYFNTGQMNLFKRYLFVGVYVDLEYNEKKSFYRKHILSYPIDYINRIYYFNIYKRISYYDRHALNNSLSQFLSNLGNLMFLDLEMTMPSYHYSKEEYTTEIIQVGYLVINSNGEEITRYSQYIKPRVNTNLSKRTLKFLQLDLEYFQTHSIFYKYFYEEFKEVLELYRPTIIIFGKNDSIVLENSFKIHKVEPLTNQMRFVNLPNLIRSYYHLRSEPGLFKLYHIYYDNEDVQIHDAFNDCEVTKAVFKAFQNEVNHLTDFYPKIKKLIDNN